MFSHADRFPLGPVNPLGGPPTPRPWGLSQMELFGSTIEVGEVAVDVDPDTQMTRYLDTDGMVVMSPGKHRKTNTGTETPTTTRNPGDRRGPTTDQDHSQDSDQD